MDADYCIVRQAGGKGAVGHVFVRLAGANDPHAPAEVALDLDPTSYFNPRHEPTFMAAAIKGCEDAIAILDAANIATKSLIVFVKQVNGSLCDSYEEVIEMAACMATLKVFGRGDQYQARFDQGWKIVPVIRCDNQSFANKPTS